MDTPRAACIYCRLSYAPDGSLEKVERQEGDCRDLGDRLGWSICCVYSDNNKSAWQRNRKRKDWDAMLASLQPGALCPKGNHHDGVLTYHGDRLNRQPWDLELLLKTADDQHIPLASPSGTRDLNNEDDRFILRIEVAQACKASADTSRRVRRSQLERAKKGLPVNGGTRPFGWGVLDDETGKLDYTKQVDDEAKVIVEAVDRLFAGQSQGGVIAWMNTVSTTTQGNKWEARVFRAMLTSPRNAALVVREGVLRPAAWEGIITPARREDLIQLLEQKRAPFIYPGRARKYLQTRNAECGSCGGYLRVKKTSGKNRKPAKLYYCDNPDCPKRVSRNMTHLDEYVIGRTLRRLNSPDFLAAVHADHDTPGIGAEIVALERRKTEAAAALEDLADHPGIDPALLARSLASFDRKIAELRNQVSVSSQQKLLARMAGMTREQWDAEPIDVQAETIRALFKVTVLPTPPRAPGFDPETVRVERRQPSPPE